MEEPDSANSSFYSTQSAPASQAGPRATSSTQSLARLGSPDDGNSALLSLPGYRPTTRSSARRSQAGVSSGAPPGEGATGTQHTQRKPQADYLSAPHRPLLPATSGLCWAIRLMFISARVNGKWHTREPGTPSGTVMLSCCLESSITVSGGKGCQKGASGTFGHQFLVLS